MHANNVQLDKFDITVSTTGASYSHNDQKRFRQLGSKLATLVGKGGRASVRFEYGEDALYEFEKSFEQSFLDGFLETVISSKPSELSISVPVPTMGGFKHFLKSLNLVKNAVPKLEIGMDFKGMHADEYIYTPLIKSIQNLQMEHSPTGTQRNSVPRGNQWAGDVSATFLQV